MVNSETAPCAGINVFLNAVTFSATVLGLPTFSGQIAGDFFQFFDTVGNRLIFVVVVIRM
jgi:hypothetical protein